MRLALAALACCALTTSAFAEDLWSLGIPASKKYVVFMDADSVRKSFGNNVRFWTTSVYDLKRAGVNYQYDKTLYEADCVDQKIKMLSVTLYKVGGENLKTDTPAYPAMDYVVPGSVGAAELDLACSDRSTWEGKATHLTDAAAANPIGFATFLLAAANGSSPTPSESGAKSEPHINPDGPSFDCTGVTSPVSIEICSSPVLAKADQEMANAYKVALGRVSNPETLRKEQRTWLVRRNAGPPTVSRILQMLRLRTEELRSVK